jgi:hypothetical protein
MGNFLDSIFPWFVGNRTQIIALALTGVKIAAAFGGIPPGIVDLIQGVALPLGAATMAAKINRIALVADPKKK